MLRDVSNPDFLIIAASQSAFEPPTNTAPNDNAGNDDNDDNFANNDDNDDNFANNDDNDDNFANNDEQMAIIFQSLLSGDASVQCEEKCGHFFMAF